MKSKSTNKQSALKRLKSSLSTAGIIGPKAVLKKRDKKRKAGQASTQSSEMQQQLSMKLKQIQQELNPFDIKVNNQKESVIGRKVKGESGRPALARQLGLEKREKTIRVELEKGTKVGGIRDRRFGEKNPEVSYEEKMLERFTKEKQKKVRKSDMYNLSDDESEEETSLTHMGQSLADIDDFDAMGLDPSDDETKGAIDARTVSASHFGGFELAKHGASGAAAGEVYGSSEHVKKSRAQVMMEVIAKSKMHKYERQQAREEDSNARMELDDEFDDIRGILAMEGNLKAGRDDINTSNIPQKDKLGSSGMSKDDIYDTNVRNLVFDQRAKPMDRLKTEEEVATEKKEFLERAERHRVRRMQGLDSGTDSDSSDDGEGRHRGNRKAKSVAFSSSSKGTSNSADSLDDDFGLVGPGLTGAVGSDYGSGSEDEADSEDSSGSSSEDDGSGDSQNELGLVSEDEDENGRYDETSALKNTTKKKAQGKSENGINSDKKVATSSRIEDAKQSTFSKKQADELPYTFKAPANYEDWINLVHNYSLEQQILIVDRLRVLYHPSLSPLNKSICEAMLEIFTEHLAVLGEQNPPVPAKIVDGFIKHTSELAFLSPVHAGNYYRQLVTEFQERVQSDLTNKRGGIGNDDDEEEFAKKAPLASDLMVMRFLVSVFSSSDKYHSVLTPVMLALCQYLSLSAVDTSSEFTKHLVVCGIIHESIRLSRRYVPEAINSLQMLLYSLVSGRSEASMKAPSKHMFPLSHSQKQNLDLFKISESEIGSKNSSKKAGKRNNKKSKTSEGPEPTTNHETSNNNLGEEINYGGLKIEWGILTSDEAPTPDIKMKLTFLRAVLCLIQKYTELYFSDSSFPEIFMPFVAILRDAMAAKMFFYMPTGYQTHVKSVVESIELNIADKYSNGGRSHLKLQDHKPIAIRSVAPKFESGYSLDRYYGQVGASKNGDDEDMETKKLRRLHKKEQRGVIRELRKDAMFISQHKLEKQKEKDAVYDKKMKAAWSVLERDQGEFKKEERLNKRKK